MLQKLMVVASEVEDEDALDDDTEDGDEMPNQASLSRAMLS